MCTASRMSSNSLPVTSVSELNGHIADRATRAVEMRGEGQPIDAAGRSRKHRGGAAHAQADAERAEGRTHALRLIVRADRIIGGVALERLALAGSLRGAAHLLGTGMAAHAVLLGRVGIERRRSVVVQHRRGGGRVVEHLGALAGRVSELCVQFAHSDRLVDHFERWLLDEDAAAHVFGSRRVKHHAAPDRLALEQAEQSVLGERLRAHRRGFARHWWPAPRRAAPH